MKNVRKFILFCIIITIIFSFQSSIVCAESFISFTSNNLLGSFNAQPWNTPTQQKTSSCGCTGDFSWGDPLKIPLSSEYFQQFSLPNNWITTPQTTTDQRAFKSSYSLNSSLNSIPIRTNSWLTDNFNNSPFPASFEFNKIWTNTKDKTTDNVIVKQTVDKGVLDWELVNPAGARKIDPEEIAPRLTTLEGKTVALFWNSKPNGNLFLDRIAELLIEQVPDITVIKLWEVMSSMESTSTNLLSSEQLEEIAQLSPDLVISSQCD